MELNSSSYLEMENTTTTLATTTLSAEQKKHKELVEENLEGGEMFASKAFVQLIANPFVGRLTNSIGYSIPMFCGFVIMFVSTVIFAFGRSYSVLFMARALQFVGKTAPFLVLAFLALVDGCLQMLILQPEVIKSDEPAPSLKALISDPYIQVCAGAITFANMGIAMLEPSLPLHMMDKMGSERWELGAAFLPASISYLIGTNMFGPLGHKMGRWKAALVGLAIIAIALILVPMATRESQLIIPMACLGFAIGMVDSSMMPELGNLVDLRHSSVYGGVYAIGDVAFCLGFAIGPALSGTLVKEYGFQKMLIGVAFICFLYCPLLTLLKDPPSKSDQEKAEQEHIVNGEKTKVRYTNYDEENGPGHGYVSYTEQNTVR